MAKAKQADNSDTELAADPGVEEGEVLDTTTHEGDAVQEKVVYDYDDDGNQIGWHKEVVS